MPHRTHWNLHDMSYTEDSGIFEATRLSSLPIALRFLALWLALAITPGLVGYSITGVATSFLLVVEVSTDSIADERRVRIIVRLVDDLVAGILAQRNFGVQLA